MAVVSVARCQHFKHGSGGTVVQVGGSAPKLNQAGGVELVRWLVEWTARADIILVEVREERWRMTLGATGLGEHPLATLCRLGELATRQVGTGKRFE